MPTNHKPPGCAGWRPLFHFNTASRATSKKQQIPSCHLPVPRDALALLRAHTIETLHGLVGEKVSSIIKTCQLLLFTYCCVSQSSVLTIVFLLLSSCPATPFLRHSVRQDSLLHMSFLSGLISSSRPDHQRQAQRQNRASTSTDCISCKHDDNCSSPIHLPSILYLSLSCQSIPIPGAGPNKQQLTLSPPRKHAISKWQPSPRHPHKGVFMHMQCTLHMPGPAAGSSLVVELCSAAASA